MGCLQDTGQTESQLTEGRVSGIRQETKGLQSSSFFMVLLLQMKHVMSRN